MALDINFFIKLLAGLGIVAFFVVYFCLFFDHARLTRKGTTYQVRTNNTKRVAITFDDGPSPIWTPQILYELKKARIPATFFMIGHHVRKYPEVARRVAIEGHEIGNHGYAHSVIFYYTPEELEEEIKYTEHVIRETTGQTTSYFRPPKAWITSIEKEKIKSMGYRVVLWSVNSKDWVTFNASFIVKYIMSRIKSGDIILFHDSGSVFKTEGGNRRETVAAIPLLSKALKDRGFEFVTVGKLLDESES